MYVIISLYGHVYFVSVIRNRNFGTPRKLLKKCVFYEQSYTFSMIEKVSVVPTYVPSRTPFLRFIRSCQNPIGRAQPKN